MSPRQQFCATGRQRFGARDAPESGNVVAIQNKLTLVSATDGSRVLPAYYGDNCISLLPGETHEMEIDCPATVSKGLAQLTQVNETRSDTWKRSTGEIAAA
jgi:hypothetical protein